MLSYQHSYHVGNHADVLKHLCWLTSISYLNQKPKPYFLLDTHAGEGRYSVSEANQEALHGVGRLQALELCDRESLSQDSAGVLAQYVDLLALAKADNCYLGSPSIASAAMRESDEMHCIELHPQAFEKLKVFAKSKGHKSHSIKCHKRDAYEGLSALIPPKITRGAVLIDPPYEQNREYKQVEDALLNAMKKWAAAQYLIWVPMLNPRGDAKSEEKANSAKSLVKNIGSLASDDEKYASISLFINDHNEVPGMFGSTLVVLNPNWKFKSIMRELMPIICRTLGSQWEWSVK